MSIQVFLQNFRTLAQLDGQTDRQTHRENSKTEQPYFYVLGKSMGLGKRWFWAYH